MDNDWQSVHHYLAYSSMHYDKDECINNLTMIPLTLDCFHPLTRGWRFIVLSWCMFVKNSVPIYIKWLTFLCAHKLDLFKYILDFISYLKPNNYSVSFMANISMPFWTLVLPYKMTSLSQCYFCFITCHKAATTLCNSNLKSLVTTLLYNQQNCPL